MPGCVCFTLPVSVSGIDATGRDNAINQGNPLLVDSGASPALIDRTRERGQDQRTDPVHAASEDLAMKIKTLAGLLVTVIAFLIGSYTSQDAKAQVPLPSSPAP